MLAVLLTPGVLANMSTNDFLTAPNPHAFGNEITVSTGVFVVRTSDTNDADRVGLGTTAPDARLHVNDNGFAAADAAAAHISYANVGSSVTTYSLKVDGTGFNEKGAEIAVTANAAKTGGPDLQRGSALGRLAYATGLPLPWSLPGRPRRLDAQRAGQLRRNLHLDRPRRLVPLVPCGPHLDGIGTYWVGGVLGQASGIVNGSAGQEASAGLIGIAAATGSAKTWAGSFNGDVKATGDSSALSVTLTATTLGTLHAGFHEVRGRRGRPQR